MNPKQKLFLSLDDLLTNIKNKGILIKDEGKLKKDLECNNYYFITGYKEPFKDSLGNYKPNIYFEDIVELYHFDKKLKLIFAEILFEIEQKVKTVFTNNFCNRYGYKDVDLVNPQNYDINSPYLLQCMSKLNNQISWYGNESSAFLYYKNRYSMIPVYVIIKVLTFGMVRDLMLNSDAATKGVLVRKIVSDSTINFNEMKNMLELLISIRNCCCHDDKLYNFIHRKVHILDTPYHSQFQLKQNASGEYLQGKKDLFAAIICIKYFVEKDSYDYFIDSISNLIDEYSKKIESISKEEIMEYLFLPSDFAKIKDL